MPTLLLNLWTPYLYKYITEEIYLWKRTFKELQQEQLYKHRYVCVCVCLSKFCPRFCHGFLIPTTPVSESYLFCYWPKRLKIAILLRLFYSWVNIMKNFGSYLWWSMLVTVMLVPSHPPIHHPLHYTALLHSLDCSYLAWGHWRKSSLRVASCTCMSSWFL